MTLYFSLHRRFLAFHGKEKALFGISWGGWGDTQVKFPEISGVAGAVFGSTIFLIFQRYLDFFFSPMCNKHWNNNQITYISILCLTFILYNSFHYGG